MEKNSNIHVHYYTYCIVLLRKRKKHLIPYLEGLKCERKQSNKIKRQIQSFFFPCLENREREEKQMGGEQYH